MKKKKKKKIEKKEKKKKKKKKIKYVGSRTIAREENCLPTLNLIQTLTLTGGQFSSGAIARIPVCL